MKTNLIISILFFLTSFLRSESYTNPWFDIKISTEFKLGSKISDAILELFRTSSSISPLDYPLNRNESILFSNPQSRLSKNVQFKNESVGIILNKLCDVSDCVFIIDGTKLSIFNTGEISTFDRFYLLPKILKTRLNEENMMDFLRKKGVDFRKEDKAMIDKKSNMIIARLDSRNHKKLEKILAEEK